MEPLMIWRDSLYYFIHVYVDYTLL